MKTHPQIAPLFKGAKRLAYGARALAVQFGFLPPEGEKMKFNLERSEMEEKLELLGIRPPWLAS